MKKSIKDRISKRASELNDLILETRRIFLSKVDMGIGVRRSQGLECQPNVTCGEISGDNVELPKSYTNLNKVPLTTHADMRTGVHYTTHANKRAFPFFALNKNPYKDNLFNSFPKQIKSLQWHSYEVQNLENNEDVTLIASSDVTKYQIFKYQNHAYGIQFHIEIKDTTVNEWGCVPEYKSALEKQLGYGALDKFDKSAKDNMADMNKYSRVLYRNFKKLAE